MSTQSQQERDLLLFSTGMAILFAGVAITWGLLIQSEVILFDGVYSGVSIVLSTLSILGLRIINSGDDSAENLENNNFHLGRTSIEPLIIAFKSAVIICVCLYGIISASQSLIHGVDTVPSSTSGMIYALISATVCLSTCFYLKRKGADLPDLVQAESEQWLIDTVFSSLVLLSFLLSFLISQTSYKAIVPYLDPGMVILGSLYFITVPIKRFTVSLKELLLMAPSPELRSELAERCDKIAKDHGLGEAIVRSSKVGRELTVDLVFVLPASMTTVEVATLDHIRNLVKDELSNLGYELWINVVFTANRNLA